MLMGGTEAGLGERETGPMEALTLASKWEASGPPGPRPPTLGDELSDARPPMCRDDRVAA